VLFPRSRNIFIASASRKRARIGLQRLLGSFAILGPCEPSPRSPFATGGGSFPCLLFWRRRIHEPNKPRSSTTKNEHPKNRALVFSVRSDFPLLTYSGNSSPRFDRAFQAESVFALENYAREAFSLETQSESPVGLGIFRRVFQRGAAEPGPTTQVLQP
jgi:hypothetical protein